MGWVILNVQVILRVTIGQLAAIDVDASASFLAHLNLFDVRIARALTYLFTFKIMK